MSNANGQGVKVSREGVVLIKSFEGFRPRAERLDDGRWIIGYGHTRSAREGATVGEGDAELLLQYDLIPVVAAIDRHVSPPLNQHQIDALASYALSVGVERFADSDVVTQINAGRFDQAAEALAQAIDAAPQTVSVDPVVRRRAAEGALFRHDPDLPVALASLLTSPARPVVSAETPSASDARAQAVAALLGETPTTQQAAAVASQADTSIADVTLVDPTSFADDPAPPSEDVVDPSAEGQAQPASDGSQVAVTAETQPLPETEPASETETETEPNPTPSDHASAEVAQSYAAAVQSWRSGVAMTAQRYAPYSHQVAGALQPGRSLSLLSQGVLQPLARRPAESAPTPEPQPDVEQAASSFASDADVAPVEAPQETIPTVAVEAADPADAPIIRVDMAGGPAQAAPLILTPPPEVETQPPAREVWTDAQRAPEASAGEGQALFDDDLNPASGIQILRSEPISADVRRFDWSETGAFMGMGAVGLAAFGASIAGFRMAQDQIAAEAFNQTTMVSWILALIGALCVGVSAFNLYLRWGRKSEG